MKFFGAVIIILVAFLAVILLTALILLRNFFIRMRRHITGDYDDETVRRMSDKYYKGEGDGAKFEKDYFKGTGRQGQYRPKQGQKREQPQQAPRTTTTSEGITIIDGRSREASQRKIFDKDEGEYVEFVEEN